MLGAWHLVGKSLPFLPDPATRWAAPLWRKDLRVGGWGGRTRKLEIDTWKVSTLASLRWPLASQRHIFGTESPGTEEVPSKCAQMKEEYTPRCKRGRKDFSTLK